MIKKIYVFLLDIITTTRFKRWLAMYYPDRYVRTYFWKKTRVYFGDNSYAPLGMKVIDDQEDITTQLHIGNRVSIGANVIFICKSCPEASENLQKNEYVVNNLLKKKAVYIEDDVWIGAGVIIMPGVKIERGSIVGAGAVVLENVSTGTVVAGVPARFIRNI